MLIKTIIGGLLLLLSMFVLGAEVKSFQRSFDSQKQLTHMAKIRSELLECRTLYKLEISLIETNIDKRVIEKELETGVLPSATTRSAAQREVVEEMRAKGFSHQRCINESKVDFTQNSRPFVQGFTPSIQPKAKDTLAQWLTAIDSATKPNFDQELSKFDTLANGLRLELSLK